MSRRPFILLSKYVTRPDMRTKKMTPSEGSEKTQKPSAVGRQYGTQHVVRRIQHLHRHEAIKDEVSCADLPHASAHYSAQHLFPSAHFHLARAA
jgi:hypothetical protein